MKKISTAPLFMLQTQLKVIVAFVGILTILPFSTVLAATYTTIAAGQWTSNSTWLGGNVPNDIVTNSDVIHIYHAVSTGTLKITNKGTIIVYTGASLTGTNPLEMNGPDPMIILQPGTNVTFPNLQTSPLIPNPIGSTTDVSITSGSTSNGNSSTNLFIIAPIAPLPVSLVYFEVKRTSQQTSTTTLEWITASEVNNSYFAVEKSLDGKIFTEAGRVPGKNASNGATYSFEDKNTAGRTYYRLKQVDFDGEFTYSAIVVASVNQKLAVHGRKVLFNNAFNGKLHLISVAGLTVKTIELRAVNTFELPDNLKGLYILQLESGNQFSTQKIRL